MYGDELCDYQMRMCWFVIIDVLSGATGIKNFDRTKTPHETNW
jgi:hypothetical protein